jgi:hypothetical protein
VFLWEKRTFSLYVGTLSPLPSGIDTDKPVSVNGISSESKIADFETNIMRAMSSETTPRLFW